MGTDETSSKKDDCLSTNNLNDVSDFYGLKSSSIIENISLNNDENETRITKKDLFSRNTESFSLIPTTFEWDNGGNSVYVTGNFCKWNQFFLMKKETENIFILTLNLPRGLHQYKFKVDGEWKYNDKFPTCNDGGNINNYIDTTNLEIIIKNNDERITSNSTNGTDNFIDISKISKKNSMNLLRENSDFCQSHNSNENEFCGKINTVPIHYKNRININLISNQNKIGCKKFLNIEEQNIFSDNLSFKKINNTPIEQNNHLYFNFNFDENNVDICAVSSRYRFKCTTFVYIKPKNNCL